MIPSIDRDIKAISKLISDSVSCSAVQEFRTDDNGVMKIIRVPCETVRSKHYDNKHVSSQTYIPWGQVKYTESGFEGPVSNTIFIYCWNYLNIRLFLLSFCFSFFLFLTFRFFMIGLFF